MSPDQWLTDLCATGWWHNGPSRLSRGTSDSEHGAWM